MLDIETEWTLNASLTTSSSYRKCSKPFLNILPEQKVRETLRLMGRSPSERLTQDVAREVCQRAQCKAMLTGSISSLGSRYVLGLKAHIHSSLGLHPKLHFRTSHKL